MENIDAKGEYDTPATLRERAAMAEMLQSRYKIQDQNVLNAMSVIPRHMFVPEVVMPHAYSDHALPLEYGQTISQPFIVARESELLEINDNDKVLEIGTGSGYQTAVLSRIAGKVFSLDRIPQLADSAQKLLRKLGIGNASIKCFDGTFGWSEFAPFRGILVAAGAPKVPQPLINQLEIGGHLVIPVGSEKEQRLLRITRNLNGIDIEDFGGCQFVKLIGKFGWEN